MSATHESPTRAATASRIAKRSALEAPPGRLFDECTPQQPSKAVCTQRAPSTKEVMFQSPPRTILSARLAALSRRAELDLPPQQTQQQYKTLDQCSAKEISLYRPTPRPPVPGFGLVRTADDVIITRSDESPTIYPEKRGASPSISSCMCSLEDSFSGSLSGLSTAGSGVRTHSAAVETPPNVPDAFAMGAELVQCYAPPRQRVTCNIARPSPKRARSLACVGKSDGRVIDLSLD